MGDYLRSSSSTSRCSILLQKEGILFPKNASRMQQLQKQGVTANGCNNLFDAMDTQLPTPTSGKKPAGSKKVASLDKPGMLSILSSFVSFVIQV
jgi:endoribonuclease Dicer